MANHRKATAEDLAFVKNAFENNKTGIRLELRAEAKSTRKNANGSTIPQSFELLSDIYIRDPQTGEETRLYPDSVFDVFEKQDPAFAKELDLWIAQEGVKASNAIGMPCWINITAPTITEGHPELLKVMAESKHLKGIEIRETFMHAPKADPANPQPLAFKSEELKTFVANAKTSGLQVAWDDLKPLPVALERLKEHGDLFDEIKIDLGKNSGKDTDLRRAAKFLIERYGFVTISMLGDEYKMQGLDEQAIQAAKTFEKMWPTLEKLNKPIVLERCDSDVFKNKVTEPLAPQIRDNIAESLSYNSAHNPTASHQNLKVHIQDWDHTPKRMLPHEVEQWLKTHDGLEASHKIDKEVSNPSSIPVIPSANQTPTPPAIPKAIADQFADINNLPPSPQSPKNGRQDMFAYLKQQKLNAESKPEETPSQSIEDPLNTDHQLSVIDRLRTAPLKQQSPNQIINARVAERAKAREEAAKLAEQEKILNEQEAQDHRDWRGFNDPER